MLLVEELKNFREWESFLENSPDGTFFHSLEWRDLVQKSFLHSPLYLTIKDATGTVVGICPGFICHSFPFTVYNSMPYSDFGGPVIARHYVDEALISLKSFLKGLHNTQGIIYAKFRLTQGVVQYSIRSPFGHSDKCTGIVRIDLKRTPSDFTWNKIFSGNRRRKIKLVERKGLEAWEGSTKSDLRSFYALYWDNMKAIGANPYHLGFMERLWDALYPKNLHIWLVGRNNKADAGVLFFRFKQESFAAYVGINREQRVHGLINYLWWKELQKAEAENCRYVSLGSTPCDPTDSYYVQKMSFGGTFHQQEIVWYPVSLTGCIMSQMRDKTITTWRNTRHFLPNGVRQRIESQLARF